jgi:DNA (cytosine-5)-methyltransferase 1
MRVLDTFAGIGGFSIGLERAGFETVAFSEVDDYASKVLAKKWPEIKNYGDIKGLTAGRLAGDGIGVDLITGGFPCQDISTAGKQAGIEGERSGLWGELARVIDEIQPRYAILENVTALISGDSGRWFGRVLGDLAQIGYDAEWHCISASAVGAHHHRDRVWIIAYPNSRPVREQSELFGRSKDSSISQFDGKEKSMVDANCGIESVGIHASESQGVLPAEAEGQGPSCGPGSSLHSADANSKRGCRGPSDWEHAADVGKPPICTRGFLRRMEIWDVEPSVGRVANGVSSRAYRLKCLGNAIVPQIAQLIGEEIMAYEEKHYGIL